MKLPAASHTFHTAWGQCPRKAWHSYIARDIEREDTQALRWGRRVHEALEAHLAHGEPLPEELSHCASLYEFKNLGYDVQAEMKLAIREDTAPCDFFDPDVYARGVIDVLVTSPRAPDMAILIDHKTGKVREDKHELELHAMLLKCHRPELRVIKGWYNWLAANRMGVLYDLSDTDAVLERLCAVQERIAHAFTLGAEAFPPKQGPLCGWCPVTKCEYHP